MFVYVYVYMRILRVFLCVVVCFDCTSALNDMYLVSRVCV